MNLQSNDPLFGGVNREAGDENQLHTPPLEGSLTNALFDLNHATRELEMEAAGREVLGLPGEPGGLALETGEERLRLEEEANNEDWSKLCERDWGTEGGNVEVDQTPLQNQLQKNKESLAVKLKLRRPMTVLVEQGIMPQYKTSPSLHEQRTKLERAQMGDRLRQKIASRPDRQELVHRHILEDVRPDVDPSLCSKQRQLKRAKLADSLATQLSHRPGPLELIQKNILHTDDPVEQMVKQGSISFTPTAQGVPIKHIPFSETDTLSLTSGSLELTSGGLPPEEDSNDTVPSPLTDSAIVSDLQSDSSCSNIPYLVQGKATLLDPGDKVELGVVDTNTGAAEQYAAFAQSKSSRSESLGDITNRPSVCISEAELRILSRSGSYGGTGSFAESSAASETAGDSPSYVTSSSFEGVVTETLPVTSTPRSVSGFSELVGPSLQREAPGKDRKKTKSKKPTTAPKPRTIKFHEYRGPEPSHKRKIDDRKNNTETAYDLLLKQQQLFLQWQLENQNKYPQILLPATSRSSLMSLGSSTSPSLIGSSSVSLNSSSQPSSSAPSPASSIPGTPRSNTPIRSMLLTPQDVNHATSILNRLDDMKVTELKFELKKRGMVVSGSKPVLVDRLRPVLEEIIAAGRQQFQQPYKQISIPRGGLIILKPSPNSQLLTRPEPNSDKPSTPQPMHEGTPESADDFPMTPQGGCGSGPNTPFSPNNSMASPINGVKEETKLEDMFRETSPQVSSTPDLEFNLNLMDTDSNMAVTTTVAPPPPPPPPPPDKRIKPAPLPVPPSASRPVANPPSVQFVPKTNQQIQLAKAQLESHLAPNSPAQTTPQTSVRAGPKGQFIWPPVSVQSGAGTMTIRARNTPVGDFQQDQRNSSTPVAQLAAVFSPAPVQISQAAPLQLSNSSPNLQLSAAQAGPPSSNGLSISGVQLGSNTFQITSSNAFQLGGFQLARSGSLQLPRNIQLPQEPVPASELGLVVTRSNGTVTTASSTCSPSVVNSISKVQLYDLPTNQLPATLPVNRAPSSELPATLPVPCSITNKLTHVPVNSVHGFPMMPSANSSASAAAVVESTSSVVPGVQFSSSSLGGVQTVHVEPSLPLSSSSVNGVTLVNGVHHNIVSVQSITTSQVQPDNVVQQQLAEQQHQPAYTSEVLKKTENIIKLQQKQIEELQSALQRSQLQLQEHQNQQQSTNMKAVLARQLQKKQLSNQIQQLQQQLVNKAQEQQAVVHAVSNHQVQMNGHVNGTDASNENIDDVLDIILRNGYNECRELTTAPPPPPPPPGGGGGRSGDRSPCGGNLTAVPPTSKSPPQIELPQLDFGELSFDLGQLPELGWSEPVVGKAEERIGGVDDEDRMDVDMDVADWLDSLIPSSNQPNSFGM